MTANNMAAIFFGIFGNPVHIIFNVNSIINLVHPAHMSEQHKLGVSKYRNNDIAT